MMISVIVPNYNHGPFLKQRIESILNQTYPEFELIILDDASSDNSREIIEQYKNNSKVSRIIYNDINSGSTFSQWEKGISLAKGDWIWIAESDDWCEPTMLEALSPAFKDNCNFCIAYCQSIAFRNDGSIIMATSNAFMEESSNGRDFVKSRMLHGNSIFNASMAIFKKNCYSQLTKKYTKYRFCGDWMFWIEMAIQGEVYISGRILNYFRKHDKDVSTQAFRSGLYHTEYIKLVNDLSDLQIIDKEVREKLIKENFKKYFLHKKEFGRDRELINGEFDKVLGYKVVLYMVYFSYDKFKNKLFLLSLALKRRLKLSYWR